MKTIKNYKNVVWSKEIKLFFYEKQHPNFYTWKDKGIPDILATELFEKLPNGNSIWIDSFGLAFQDKRVISLELMANKEIISDLHTSYKVHYSSNFISKTALAAIKKVYDPTSIVFYYPTFFRYISIQNLKNILNIYNKSFEGTKIFACIDLQYLQYNRIVFSNDELILYIAEDFKHSNTNIEKISNFKYMLEIY